MDQIPIAHKSFIQKSYVRLKEIVSVDNEKMKKSDWPHVLKYGGAFILFAGIFGKEAEESARLMIFGGLVAFIVGWKTARDDYQAGSDRLKEQLDIRRKLEEIEVHPDLHSDKWRHKMGGSWCEFDPLCDDSYH